MRSVSLNLDLEDAAIVRRDLAAVTAACACQTSAGLPQCADCLTRAGMIGELDRLLSRAAVRREAPVAAAAPGLAVACLARSPLPAVRAERSQPLVLLRGGLADE